MRTVLLACTCALSLLVLPVAAAPNALVPTPTAAAAAAVAPHADADDQYRPLLQKRQDPPANSNSASSATSISVPANAAAGGLSYTQPALTDAVSYYKIAPSNAITFGWNYTSLYATPSSLTFEARCSANGFTYPIGPTTGISASETELVWDPYAYAQSANAIPFAQASYTLRVYDERGINAAATPGYFNGANAIVYFALYSPAAYTPLADGWRCVACSSALSTLSSTLSHPLLVALPITAALVLIGGAGVLGR